MSLYLGDMPIANDGIHRITGEIGDMGFAPLGIDESLNLRRYLNGQVISQTQFISFTTKVKSAVALFPNLSTTEANWQAEKLLSKFGQVGKFVIDDENQTIRLPAVVNAQGLLGLSGIGNLVNESLPNITGSFHGGTAGADGAFIDDPVMVTAGWSNLQNQCFRKIFNASNSSSTYQNSAPVQQEAVQYPYYIQVATGVEETLPAIREYKVNNSDYFGKSMYSDVAPDNASWLASNGSYNARAVYPDYYDWLVSHIGETITDNGGKVVLSTGTITDYDFVVNQNDQTFRLPLLDGSEDLPSDTYDTLTLPPSGTVFTAPANGFLILDKLSGGFEYAALVNSTTKLKSYQVVEASGREAVVCVQAKRGDQISPLYNLSGTTYNYRFIYAKGNGTLYYYVGDTIQDASLINAGAVLGQLSNKADIDASNFNATGKSLLSGLGMPSGRYINLTLGASGSTYTAPANGWFGFIASTGGTNNYAVLYHTSKIYANKSSSNNNGSVYTILPVLKGESVYLFYEVQSLSSLTWRFFYAEGEN